jgi:hypothetical protein
MTNPRIKADGLTISVVFIVGRYCGWPGTNGQIKINDQTP